MNIYKITRPSGNTEYRAGKRSTIGKFHYDNERVEIVKVEILQHNVSYREVYDHKLPILICV